MLCQKQHAEVGFRHSNDFDVEDKECSDIPKKFEDKELRHYFIKTHVRYQLNLQNHKELITQVSKYLKALGMIQK